MKGSTISEIDSHSEEAWEAQRIQFCSTGSDLIPETSMTLPKFSTLKIAYNVIDFKHGVHVKHVYSTWCLEGGKDA